MYILHKGLVVLIVITSPDSIIVALLLKMVIHYAQRAGLLESSYLYCVLVSND